MSEEYAIPDVHADAAALQSMLDLLPESPHVVFLGDIVNKGPSSLEAIQLLREASKVGEWKLLWGNHDLLFIRAILGSLDAQLKLFTQGGGTAVLAELGQPHLCEVVANVFCAASVTETPLESLMQHQSLLSEVNQLISESSQLARHIEWMIRSFQLFHVSPRGILYIHAGIPVTTDGEACIDLKELGRIDTVVSASLEQRETDASIFENLDASEKSPLRVTKWVQKINDPKRFCEALGVRAIVVGHSEISPAMLKEDSFPIIRHDFGAARCKGDTPSVLHINADLRFTSRIRVGGAWQSIHRGSLI